MRKKSDTVQLAPTDLSNFLSCRHLSALDLRAATGQVERPVRYGPLMDELRARGIAHEQHYLENLAAQGLRVAQAAGTEFEDLSTEEGLERTLQAMSDGADVVFQATLSDDTWFGRADFLLKVDAPSNLGDWSYEVTDTKLARDTKAGTILQLYVYSCLLENLQGRRPERMHVVTPGNNFTPVPYRLDDYSAYVRILEKGLAQFVQVPGATYPELVSHCDLCPWWEECEKRRRGDDHLCYVAGISSSQIKSLRALGINRLGDLGALHEVPKPPQGSREALVRVRDQARVQVVGREKGAPYHELLEPFDANHGFSLLPEPTDDDIFLDFEGNHFAEEGVREYLAGFVARNTDGKRVYRSLWATTLEEERKAFEQFMDFATETRQRNPNVHIYHFAPYEPSALKRLMGRFASREVQLDELLRGGVFVDLHKVVRRALIASVESYSIKDLEPFFGYSRDQNLRDAAISRRIIEHAIEAGVLDEAFEAHREIIEDYNREDCESAERLRDWLEELRGEVIAQGYGLSRPGPHDGEASEKVSDLDRELQRLRDGLLKGVPNNPAVCNEEQHARFVLAHMMEFHRREDKASWWEYFRLLGLDYQDYADERKAIVGLIFQETIATMKAPLQRYRFPPQELDARSGDGIYIDSEKAIGKVEDVDYAARTIDVKKTTKTGDIHPNAVVLYSRVPSHSL